MQPTNAPVLIVGGGMAGLATAYELQRRGIEFLLLEAGARVGGVVLSEQACVSGEMPDAIGWKRACHSVLVECKITRLTNRSEMTDILPLGSYWRSPGSLNKTVS